MSGEPLKEIVKGTFSSRVLQTHEAIVVQLVGTADVVAQPHMAETFEAAHQAADVTGIKNVRVDIRGLTFMNSSCFKHVVLWIQKVLSRPSDTRYGVTFLSTPSQAWQPRALKTLAHLGGSAISIETA